MSSSTSLPCSVRAQRPLQLFGFRKTPDLSLAPLQASCLRDLRAQIWRRAVVGSSRPFAHSGKSAVHKRPYFRPDAAKLLKQGPSAPPFGLRSGRRNRQETHHDRRLHLRRRPHPARQGPQGRLAARGDRRCGWPSPCCRRCATATSLDTHLVDDVVLGCVMPIGEQGADIARTAVRHGRLRRDRGRACRSTASAPRAWRPPTWRRPRSCPARARLAIGGGVELMSRVPMGSDGGAWPVDPAVAIPMYFVPQGISADLIATKYGLSRDDVDAYAVELQKRAKAGLGRRLLQEVDRAGEGPERRCELLGHDEHMRPDTTMQTLAALEPSFKMQGEAMPGFDARGAAALSRGREDQPRPPCRQLVGHRRRRRRPCWSAARSSARRPG